LQTAKAENIFLSAPDQQRYNLSTTPVRLSNYFSFIFFFAEFVEAMTEAYPIVEELRLTNRHQTIPPDHTAAILSAFRFPHLTFLKLCNFQLLDGAALLPVKF